jgi:vacuolar protein sorting-associated protein VTA1
MQATKQFGEMSEDIEEKLQYAKWRAAEISKSIKTGQPPPPPPGQEELPEQGEEDDFHPISQKEHVDEAFSKPILEKKPSQFNDPFFNQPTQVQKPLEKNFNDFFDSVKPSGKSNNDNAFNDDFFSSVQPGYQNSFGGETKSTSNQPTLPVKSNNQPPPPGPNLPKSNQPLVNNQLPKQPTNQPKQPIKDLPPSNKELEDFFSGFKTPNNQFTEQPKNEKNVPPTKNEKSIPPTNQNKPSTTPSSNQTQPQVGTPASVKPTPVVEAPKTQSVKTEFVLQRHNVPNTEASMEDILQAQKFAKFAVSSLQFPDVATAVKYLEDALAILVKK